jgi:hypothetical protein
MVLNLGLWSIQREKKGQSRATFLTVFGIFRYETWLATADSFCPRGEELTSY